MTPPSWPEPFKVPPDSTFAPLMIPPEVTATVPPDEMMVAVAVPPEDTVWVPPFETTALVADPPLITSCAAGAIGQRR